MANVNNPAAAEIIFLVPSAPRFCLTVPGSVQELQSYPESESVFALLPAATSGEWAFKVGRYARKERIFRLRLPEDAAAAAAIKEMTAADRWGVHVDNRAEPANTLVATYKGLYLPPCLAPLILEACAPSSPPARPEIMAEALQPHVLDRVLRFAINSTINAARTALASSVWAAGVREWMLTPRLAKRKLTGLPRALRLEEVLTTPDDAAAAVAVLRAQIHPARDVAARLAKAYKEGIPDDSLCFMGVEEEFERTHRVEFKVAKLEGMPGVTFVWREYCTHIDCSQGVTALYLLEAREPAFRLLLAYSWGEMETETDIHLPRYLSLRQRLRAAFPALVPVSDVALLAILAEATGGRGASVADPCALVRLVPGHPDRGDGQPRTEAECKQARWGQVPKDVGKEGCEPAPRQYCGGMMAFHAVRGMAVPLLDSTSLGPAVKRAMRLIDAFHQAN